MYVLTRNSPKTILSEKDRQQDILLHAIWNKPNMEYADVFRLTRSLVVFLHT